MSAPLTAGDVCTRSVTIVEPTLGVIDAARLMREHHVGCVVVVREEGFGRVPVGMLTDRDIVTAIVAREVDLRTLRVEDVMSSHLVSAREEDSVLDVLSLMRRKGVRRIPVTGQRGELVGLVALDDLLEIVAEQMQAIVAAVGTEQNRERAQRA
jgi:CBS domain-containing protein